MYTHVNILYLFYKPKWVPSACPLAESTLDWAQAFFPQVSVNLLVSSTDTPCESFEFKQSCVCRSCFIPEPKLRAKLPELHPRDIPHSRKHISLFQTERRKLIREESHWVRRGHRAPANRAAHAPQPPSPPFSGVFPSLTSQGCVLRSNFSRLSKPHRSYSLSGEWEREN